MTMKKIEIPTPHGDKLRALAENSKLPVSQGCPLVSVHRPLPHLYCGSLRDDI